MMSGFFESLLLSIKITSPRPPPRLVIRQWQFHLFSLTGGEVVFSDNSIKLKIHTHRSENLFRPGDTTIV
jgi:hypothetical protein